MVKGFFLRWGRRTERITHLNHVAKPTKNHGNHKKERKIYNKKGEKTKKCMLVLKMKKVNLKKDINIQKNKKNILLAFS